MPSFYSVNGVDLDDIFEPIGSYNFPTTPINTGFSVGTSADDLRLRYLPLSEGSRISGNTGYVAQSLGLDLADVFAMIGSGGVSEDITFEGVREALSAAVVANQTEQEVSASVTCNFLTDGAVIQVESNTESIARTYNSKWFNDAPEAGFGNDYEIFIDDTDLVRTGEVNFGDIRITNSSIMYTPLTSTRGIQIECSTTGGTSNGEPAVNGNIIVNIRRIGTNTVYSKTINIGCIAVPV